jgi:hypothetical protein
MDIELHLFATLAKYLPEDATSKMAMIAMAPGETVQDLITGLGIPENTVKLIFINGVHGKTRYRSQRRRPRGPVSARGRRIGQLSLP